MASYTTAQDSYRDSQIVRWLSAQGEYIAEFPLNFLSQANVEPWAFMLDVLGLIVESDGDNARLLSRADGSSVDTDVGPIAGTYIFRPSSTTLVFSRGPEYFRKGLAADLEAGQSTRSRSKSRSSTNQTRFRVAVGVRDSQCLVTGVDYESCTACHIVPQSREDLYRAILDTPRIPPIFHPSAGILLEDALHRAFDRLELSLYPIVSLLCASKLTLFESNGCFVVHYFNASLPGARIHHGKVITAERFHSSAEKHPDPRLLRWHYQQCSMARFRGFAAGLTIPASSAQAMETFGG